MIMNKWYWIVIIILSPLIITFLVNYYSEKNCEKKCLLDTHCLDKCHDKFARKI